MIQTIKCAPDYGLVFVGDAIYQFEVPDDTGAALVTHTPSCVAVGVLPKVDGEAEISLSDLPPDNGGDIVFDGEVHIPSKTVAVSDANGKTLLECLVSKDQALITIWANDPILPSQVHICAL